MNIVIGLLIPFLGTTLGSSFVFLFRQAMGRTMERLFLGFASGVMIAASIWSLLLPALDLSEHLGSFKWVPAVVGFLLGILFLLLLDQLIPHLHADSDEPEGLKAHLNRKTMLILAVTLHNIPEGMAVGVVFAGLISGNTGVSLMACMALSLGIALQNIPEGAVISAPLTAAGVSKPKAFVYGILSGIVEPIFAGMTLLMTEFISGFLPYILAFAAGAMIYVVVEELIPEAQSGHHSNLPTLGVAFGFVLMLILDVALS